MDPYHRLELEFGNWISTPSENMAACSSGSAALHLALESFRLPPGSEVIVPEFTMVACARAVTLAGLKPVFVDCDDDLLISIDHLKRKITKNTRAIMAVHIYGRTCDMDAIGTLADKRHLLVIEDCSESHGAFNDYVADATCWSFYKNKIIHGEEGGMVAFNRTEDANIAKQLRNHGFTEAHDFLHSPHGWNYRMSNAHAKLILKSLEQAPELIMARSHVEHWYDKHINPKWKMPPRRVCWVYDISLLGINTTDVVKFLNNAGVQARLGFKPMSEQSEYRHPTKSLNGLCAFFASRRIIYLPVVPEMTEEDVKNNCEILEEAVKQAGPLTESLI